jgi:hypothetical protein
MTIKMCISKVVKEYSYSIINLIFMYLVHVVKVKSTLEQALKAWRGSQFGMC